MTIDEELLEQNLKIVDWVQKKLQFCDTQITIWKYKFKQTYKYYDKEYISGQIGKYVIEKKNLEYFLYLLNKDYSSLLSSINENSIREEQLKIKMRG